MAVPWFDSVRNSHRLTVFATQAVTGGPDADQRQDGTRIRERLPNRQREQCSGQRAQQRFAKHHLPRIALSQRA